MGKVTCRFLILKRGIPILSQALLASWLGVSSTWAFEIPDSTPTIPTESTPPSTAEISQPFFVGFSLGLPGSVFSLIPLADGWNPSFGDRMDYRPSSRFETTLQASWRFLGGSLSFTLPPLFDFQNREGPSSRQDLRLSTDFGRLRVELAYQHYQGYLIENSSRLSTLSLNGAAYYHLPELQNTGGGLTLFYVPNEDYSMAAGFDQTRRQLRSAGSLLLLVSGRAQGLRSPTAIIPTEMQSFFGDEGTLSAALLKSIGAGAGYAYTVTLYDVFISASLAAELGPQWVRYTLSSGERDYAFLGVHSHAKLNLGLNQERLVAGASLAIDGYTEGTRWIQIWNFSLSGRLFAGFRF